MQIRALKVFCDVVTRKSFSKAADDNGITQSAASQTIHQIESHFGVKLLDRSKRPFVMTEEGKVCFDHCVKLVRQFEELESRLSNLHSHSSDTVRVASIYSVGLSYMKQFVQRFTELNPQINVQLEYHHPSEVYNLVKSGDADLGLLSYPTATNSVAVIPWREEKMSIVISPDHPLASDHEVSLNDLNGFDMVGFDQNLRIGQEINRVLANANATPNVVMEFDNIETLKRAIEINAGFSILPQAHVQREVSAGTLTAVTVNDNSLVRPVGIIHRDNIKLGKNTENFIELLIEDVQAPSAMHATPQTLQTNTEVRSGFVPSAK
ncbi:MAG: transcriptional regulator [Rhodopirellula sp.]|nr:transcriptional regulator [Rhodopirellula sp.]|tara:strand:- start:365 stop:1330 length:966 start_codon:yes stop_codon:yes gene_type:complete